MENAINQILEIVKEYENIDNEALYKLKIKTLIVKCLNYCHLEELPPQLINPIADTVATATYMGADVDWYIKADDIILKRPTNNQPTESKPNQNKK